MSKVKAPSPPYLGPANHHGGHNNKPIHRIVMHSTVSPCEPGGARSIAGMFRSTSRYASAHYVVDPNETVQVVYDSVVAYHAPPNEHSIGVEMCDMPSTTNKARWKGKNHRKMLKRAAKLVAQLCLAYDVPIQKINAADLRAGKHGICGHVNVSHAWHETTHWDPGVFPWRRFIRMVRKYAKAMRNGKPVANTKPAPDHTIGGFDMASKKDRKRLRKIVRSEVRKALLHTEIPVNPADEKDKKQSWQLKNVLRYLVVKERGSKGDDK